MRAKMTADEMKKLHFIGNLPYPELVEAHKIIDKGADVALLYFWFNLIKAHYYPLFKIIDVEKQCVYYCQRNPEFEKEIIDWFKIYESITKAHGANNNSKAIA